MRRLASEMINPPSSKRLMPPPTPVVAASAPPVVGVVVVLGVPPLPVACFPCSVLAEHAARPKPTSKPSNVPLAQVSRLIGSEIVISGSW
jgi:hypothetical protein